MYYQDQLHPPPREIRAPASPNTRNTDNSDPGSGTQLQQQEKDSNYVLPPHMDQHHQHQQYIQTGTHHVHHPAESPATVSPYYQVYPQAPQQFHHPIDQQYPVYVRPVPPQTLQPYNISLQSNIADTTTVVVSSWPLASPSLALGIPPVYPAKAASTALPEMAASGVFKTNYNVQWPLGSDPAKPISAKLHGLLTNASSPSPVHCGYSSTAGNYAFAYTNPAPAAVHRQVFYTRHQAAMAAPSPLPSQYLSMTVAVAIAMSEVTKQLPVDNNIAQQNITSQPLIAKTGE